MNIKFLKPVKGDYFNIEEASDEVFSQKLLGPGFLIKPKDSYIYAPVHGRIKMIYPTLHAIAIQADNFDVLIHVGLTEKLRHKNLFHLHVSLNDIVNAGDLLLSFNFNLSDYQESDYEIPVVFVQKQSLEIIHENENDFELTIL